MNMKQIITPLYQAKAWMKFLGIMMILTGVGTMFGLINAGGVSLWEGIIGIPIAVLSVWMGVLLFQATSKVEQAYSGEDEAPLVMALEKIKMFFVINSVLVLIYLIVNLLPIITLIT